MNKNGVFLIVLLGILKPLEPNQDSDNDKYDNWYNRNAEGVRKRLDTMIQEHYRDCVTRVQQLLPMRFMYEESPHYEIGYIMGEILDRYKKMVFNVRRPTMYKSDTVFETLRNLEWIQKYYFEMYHLINMMHEISEKWKGHAEFADLTKPTNYRDIRKIADQARHAQKILEREKRKRLKKMRKVRETLWKDGGVMEIKHKPWHKQTPYNRWWPIDYGWEVNYYW